MSWEVVEAEGLALPGVADGFGGRGVTVAVVDTGVSFGHPHVATAARGWSVRWEDGVIEDRAGGFSDRIGHGTCCAALIRLLAPEAELFAVRVTEDRVVTDADRLAHGICVAVREGAHLVSVAMGTRTRLSALLQDAVTEALAVGVLVVAANPNPEDEGTLPAACVGAIAAHHEDGVDVIRRGNRLFAEGRARPAPGFRSNFWGSSLSTARISAALARTGEQTGLRGEALSSAFSNLLDVR